MPGWSGQDHWWATQRDTIYQVLITPLELFLINDDELILGLSFTDFRCDVVWDLLPHYFISPLISPWQRS